MTPAGIAAVIARVERCGVPLDRWDAAGVWSLADALDVTITPTPDGRLQVRGERVAVLFLATSLRQHKSALRRGACARCRHLLAAADGLCAPCAQLRGRVYTYEPGSLAETSYLTARMARLSEARLTTSHRSSRDDRARTRDR